MADKKRYDPKSSAILVGFGCKDKLSVLHTCSPILIRPTKATDGKAQFEFRFPTIEHLCQALRFPERPDVQVLIAGNASPTGLRSVVKLYHSHGTENWESLRVVAMRYCLAVRLFERKDDCLAAFDLSGDQPIVSLHPHDDYWHTTISTEHGGDMVGENITGRLWMELRKLVRDGEPVQHILHERRRALADLGVKIVGEKP